jgi:hypothetical protein
MPEKDISGKRTSARPALSELDIYGSLGSWGLAGPRRLPWIVDGESKQINLKGTSAAYLELSANQSPGPRRLCLKGSPGSKIQVSVVRLEEASPQIELEVAWSSIASGKTTAEKNPAGSSADRQPAGGDCLHTSVRFLGGQDLMIEQIALEQNSAETHASMCFLGTSLAQFECDQRAATARSMRPMASRFFDLPTTRLSACDVPIVVKVVAVDRRGIRTSAWAIVNRDARPQGEHLARLAR